MAGNFGWRDLLAMQPARVAWQDNLRLLAPVLLALIGFSVAGRFVEGLLTALGAYIVLFGAGQPGALRLKVLLTASAFILVAVGLGILTAGSFPLTVLAFLGVAIVAVAADVALQLGSPGPYFFVMMVGGGATVGQSGLPLGAILPYIVAGSGLGIAFAMADVFYDRHGVERRAIAAARAAVTALARSVGDVPSAAADRSGTMSTDVYACLAGAAAAVHRAWSIFMADAGRASGTEARKLERDLREVHAGYLRLYSGIVERSLFHEAPSPRGRKQLLAALGQADAVDAENTAIGEPSLGYRFAAEMTWPSATLIHLVRIGVALVLASVITHLAGDHHPFWAILVIVLVLSYPGSQRQLTLRAVQRLLGTLAGIGAFALLLVPPMNQVAYVVLLCVLMWLISRLTTRNYLYGSVLITILALAMTVPLAPDQTPLALMIDRGLDTVVAVAIALAMIHFIGPQFTAALVKRSIRRISCASLAVIERGLAAQALTDPGFVEDRRRLQYSLLHVGNGLDVASASAAAHAAPYIRLERACARLGYLVLGSSWSELSIGEREQLVRARMRLSEISAAPLNITGVERSAEMVDVISGQASARNSPQ